MIIYAVLKLQLDASIAFLAYLSLVGCLMFQVWRDCQTLGEGFYKFVIPIIFLPSVFSLGWLLIWPGTLRLRLSGKRAADLAQAKIIARLERNRKRDKHT